MQLITFTVGLSNFSGGQTENFGFNVKLSISNGFGSALRKFETLGLTHVVTSVQLDLVQEEYSTMR